MGESGNRIQRKKQAKERKKETEEDRYYLSTSSLSLKRLKIRLHDNQKRHKTFQNFNRQVKMQKWGKPDRRKSYTNFDVVHKNI
jgi:hypothetical protein